MIISEDRQSHLAHMIADALYDDDLVDYTDDDFAIRLAKKALPNLSKRMKTSMPKLGKRSVHSNVE